MKIYTYKKYEGTPIWECLNNSIKALVTNGDIEEKTRREYIIGYLITSLVDKNIILN